MKTEIVEDKLLKTIPVYLSKSLLDKLHVLQYPTHPFTRIHNEEPIIKARVKPENCLIELEVGIRTRTSYFDRSKGEQIALNVDGAGRNQKAKEENYFKGNVMDKLFYVSTQCMVNINNYALGVMADGCLHLSPVTAMVAMKPSFEYLDTADKRRKNDSKEQVEDMTDLEEATKKVTVRFERPETERSRDYKEKSYAFLQKKIRDEPWINPNYHTYGSERSKLESRYLYCSYPNEAVDQFALNSDQYLKSLIPQDEEEEVITSGLPADHISVTALKALPLQERLKVIIQNAVAASFNELICSVANKNKSEDPASILKAIQQNAVLVQGNWVVKSEFVYPKDGVSESNVANETLQKTRDYILYQFTKNTTVSRSSISEAIIPIPAQDLTKVFKGIAKCKVKRGTWDFLLPTDTNFIKKHPEVAQRQQMIWQSRYEQLSQNFLKKK